MGARRFALQVLNSVFENDAYAGIALDREFKKNKMDERDKALAAKIVYGVIQNLLFIDYQIENNSGLKLKKITPVVLNILRLSLYQIFFLDKVPNSAVVNEGVELVKKSPAKKAAGFVNAVLRSAIRSGQKLPEDKNKLQYLSVLYSYPLWMVKLWASGMGTAECEKLLAAGNEDAPLTVRINKLKISADDFLSKVDGEKTPLDSGVRLNIKGDITKVYGFEEGFFTVQDTASQMVSLLMAPEENDRVLDVCAAPGGKTTHLAELMNNKGEVVAWDLYDHKINLINQAAKRLGLTGITARVHDSSVYDNDYRESFDRVLVDAPCSGLGIIRKKPDIKWKRKEGDIDALCVQQHKILSTSANYVKPGGVLLYSTCTINKKENEGTVERFLADHKQFKVDGEAITLYPHTDNTDGFFMCKLIKAR